MNKDDGVLWHIKTDESDESGMIIQISVNGEMSRFVKFIGLEILCSTPSQEKLNLNSSFGLGPNVEKYLFSDAKASDGCLLPEYLIVNRSNSGSKGMPTEAEWNKAGVVNMMERNELVLDGVPVCPNLVLLFLQRNSRLRHVPASFFDRMSVLSFLDLSNTRIKELPSSLFTLENLQVLLLRSCVCLKSLHADIKNLKKLEVLDALGTNLHKFPKEIEELSQLRHLHLSFYFPDYGIGYAGVPSELIPPGATFQLQDLHALSIAVHPEDKRWKKIVSDIIKHVIKLEKLSYLQFYFPTVKDLKSFIEESPSWKEHRLKRFKFIVGHDIKRIVSRVPDEVESEYDQHNRCLRFVHGSEVPQVMKRILTPVTAFYLDHHSEIKSLSEFGISNFKELRFCVVRECPNIQFVIVFEKSQSAAFPNLEYLGLHYLWELEQIWEGPVPSGSFEALKYLMVATCPKLEYIASRSTLQSLSKLETFIIEDCESLKSVVEENEMVKYDDGSLLPRLTKLVLRHLPQLASLGSGLFLSEEHVDTHCCPKLILIPSLSSRDYNVNTFVGTPGVETSQVHKSEISHEDPSSSEGRREKIPIGGGESYDVSKHSNKVVFQPELSVLESESNPSERQIEMNKCDGGRIACPRPARSRRNFLGCFSNYGDISISVKRPDTRKVSPPKLVKEDRPVANQSPVESAAKEVDVGKSSCDGEADIPKARPFTFANLVVATQNFKEGNFLGEGGFGRVYKGRLPETGEIVAVKQLDRGGSQGIWDFVVEVMTLSMADHPNLVKLIGYCAEGDQRLLVYEYMPLGSLEDHLYGFGLEKRRLDWNTRMQIAAGAARGLEYLHDKMKKPIIYRDLKCSNILLGEGYHPKLSDFGLAKVGPSGDQIHVSTRVMSTYGYCAPDYAMTGQLTFKSDIYSFGVVLLEIITGRRAIDNRRPGPEANLVSWAKPLFKDRKKFHKMVDPSLEGEYPVRGLYQALAIAAMCVQEQPNMRPLVADVVTALNYLATQTYDPKIHGIHDSNSSPTLRSMSKADEQRRPTDNENQGRGRLSI